MPLGYPDYSGLLTGTNLFMPSATYQSADRVALNCLVCEKIAFLHFGVKIQDGGSPPSWILGVQ